MGWLENAETLVPAAHTVVDTLIQRWRCSHGFEVSQGPLTDDAKPPADTIGKLRTYGFHRTPSRASL